MKCPKCGYHSFESLDNCKKCSHDLKDHKAKFHLRGLTLPGTALTAETAETAETATPSVAGEAEKVAAVDSADNESIDFGFDFLEEDEAQTEKSLDAVSLGGDDQEFNLDQPFQVDSEAVPAESPAEKKDKHDKGSEFAF
jgi:hypothetical protein